MAVKKTTPAAYNIVLIGAGNVASILAEALQMTKHRIVQVYSRTPRSASLLGKKLNTAYTTALNRLLPADLYIIAVKDDALVQIARKLRTEGTVVHTSGTMHMQILKQCAPAYGVFYPLQTFSKERKINLQETPVCVEANNKKTGKELELLAHSISKDVHFISSEKRKAIHLAAVFASNFSNHMYSIAASLLQKQKLPFKLLIPLIEETAAKAKDHDPRHMQTGPAIRRDKKTMEEHLRLLSEDKDLQRLYRLISRHITEF